MNDDVAELVNFGKRWAKAEIEEDVTVLDALATMDLVAITCGSCETGNCLRSSKR